MVKQVVICVVCGAKREEESNHKITKVHIPPCKLCGGSLVAEDLYIKE